MRGARVDLVGLAMGWACAAAVAATPVKAPLPRPVVFAPIVVQGARATPAIWELRKGNKTLWILGTLYPVPKGVDWDPAPIRIRVAVSQVVLGPMGMSVGENIGFVRGLFLLPALRRSRFNPDGRTLHDVLPPATYARWESARARFLPEADDVERFRPIYAAFELDNAAIARAGLEPPRRKSIVEEAAKHYGVPIVDVRLKVRIDAPRKALKQFNASQLDDARCLEETLDRIDHDLVKMRERAEAWAAGDVERLRTLPVREQWETCLTAFGSTDVARQHGVSNVPRQMEARWLAEARKALATHDRVFSTLPVSLLLRPDGLLGALRKDGYVVIAEGGVR